MKYSKLYFMTGLFLSACLFISCKQTSGGSDASLPVTTTADFPVFSPAGGFYREAQTVSISNSGNAALYYTTDLSTPNENSAKYTEPFTVDTQCVIRAVAIDTAGNKKYAMTAFDFDLDRTTDYKGTTLSSPNWQDQIIYFVMLDRFFDGDTSNNKQNITNSDGSAYDETKPLPGQPVSGYNGGDFAGLKQKLQYIKDLGATAIWITPPIRNQVSEGNYDGFHGYWASDFTRTDPHFGTLAEYQALVSAAHDMGLAVIQDIVVNHTGDYQKIAKPLTAKMITNGTVSSAFSLNTSGVGLNDSSEWTHPEQLPWKFNDPSKLTADEFTNNSFYHFNPGIANISAAGQRFTWQCSDLDDINTNNPVVRNLLRGYFRYWIDKCNIDGYRIDTVFYVEPDFFEDFINSSESGNKGVREYAKDLGKNDFIDFGEAWTTDESIVTSYTKGTSNRIDSALYFPLTFALRDTASGNGTTKLAEILDHRYTIGYQNPDRLVSFIDNHDQVRILNQADSELVKGVYTLMFSIPGVPQIYYGFEQGFTECRAAMFAGGLKSSTDSAGRTTNDSDCFTESGNWWNFTKNLISLRKENRVLRYNNLKVLQSSASAGIFAAGLQGLDENNAKMTGAGCRAVYILNNSSSESVVNLSATDTNILKGDKFVLNSISTAGYAPALTAGESGVIQFIAPPKSYALYILTEEGTAVSASAHSVTLDNDLSEATTVTVQNLDISGTSSDDGTLYVVLNHDYTSAHANPQTVTKGLFSIPKFSIRNLSEGLNTVELVLELADGTLVYSSVKSFIYAPVFKTVLTVSDPAGDDTGPSGFSYSKYTGNFKGEMDITGVEVQTVGSDIKLKVSTSDMSREWTPTVNQFDHVMFSVFLAKPGSTTGCTVQPKQNYTLPDNFSWDYMYQPNGWGTAFYSSIGADKDTYGTAVTPLPACSVTWSSDITVKKATPGLIEFTIKASSIGNPDSLEGWKIYINTWDLDMGALRAMVSGDVTDVSDEKLQWKFGSGSADPETSPKVMDETSVMTIPAE